MPAEFGFGGLPFGGVPAEGEDVCEAVVATVGRPDIFARTSAQSSLVVGDPGFKPVAAMVCLGDNESEPEQEKFTA